MAKTGAERQAEYRAQRAREDSADRRINTWVSKEAYQRLEALAERYGVTRRGAIELLLMDNVDQCAKPLAPKEFVENSSVGDDAALLRNDVPVVTLPAIEELHAGALLRNRGRGAGGRRRQSQPVEEVQPSPLDGQFELGL